MKKSYKKIIIFEIFIFILLLLNCFDSSILKNYNTPLFLYILIIIFRYILGLENDKYRYKKDLVINILIDVIIYYIAFYFLGLFVGYAKNENYLNFIGIVKHIFPLILMLPLNQLLRYGLLKKCGDYKLLIILTTLVFIFFDISPAVSVADFKTKYGILVFIALTVLPSISKNIYLTYITRRTGYFPGAVYLMAFFYPMYLLPIVPNPNVYITAIIQFIIPIIFFMRSTKFFSKTKITNSVDREYQKRRYTGIITSVIISMILVYFVSGYFRYYAIAVASGSMTPKIYKGDVVVVDQHYKHLKKGDIIAFKVEKTVIVHRMINKAKDGKLTYYYTKGDANDKEDNYELKKEDIIGIVKFKIPLIGYPTVWFSKL